MATLTSLLPAPKHQQISEYEEEQIQEEPTFSHARKFEPPSYGNRKGFVPRRLEDFGDGGAFPEIHVAQYPLDMGRKEKASKQTLALTLDGEGNVNYDAVVKHGNANKVVYSKFTDLIERRVADEDLARPSEEEELANSEKTRQALQKIVDVKIAATHVSQPDKVQTKQEATFLRYTPAQKGAGFNSGAENRIIRMTEAPVDPFEPPKFKSKKLPRGPPSPPPPVMHSPPRKLTVADMQNWKIPPCISNWKNPKGYTIPLDKRLAADGRGLQETQINDGFAKLSEALYIAERNAREEVEKRAQLQRKLLMKQKEAKEEELRTLAQRARMAAMAKTASDEHEEQEDEAEAAKRDRLREERRKEIEYERRKAAHKSKGKVTSTRDEDRDITEKIALGQASRTVTQDTLFDSRLFNSSAGMSSGFGDDDTYNVYDRPMLGNTTSQIYRPTKGDTDTYGGEEAFEKLARGVDKFRPDKDFSGVDRTEQPERSGKPVQFERDTVPEEPEEDHDVFGLESFLSKGSSKKTLDSIGKSGHMSASGQSNYKDEDSYKDSKRSRLNFESSSPGRGDDSGKRRRR